MYSFFIFYLTLRNHQAQVQYKSIQQDSVQRFVVTYNKQLLDEVEHDIMNYHNRGLCYLPKPKAEADNTDTRF